MLEPAQEAVRFDQRVRRPFVRTSGGGEGAQRVAGRARAQRRVAPAPDELLRLRVELDLANAAPAAFDVVAGDLDRAAVGLDADLPLDRLDVLDRREIEIFAPDEGPEPLHDVGTDRRVAGNRARLDHRGALPVLPVALVVLLGGQRGQRERRAPGVGPQPQVGPIQAALVRAFAEQGAEIAHEAVHVLRRLAPPPVAHTLGVEEHDQGKLARIGELTRPERAQAEHGEPAGGRRLVRVGCREDAAGDRRVEQMVERAGEHGIRDAGEGRGDRLRRPGAGNVGKCRDERRPPPGRAQPQDDAAAVAVAAGGSRHALERALEGSVGAALGHDAKLGRFAGQCPAEGWAVAQHGGQESARLPLSREGGGKRVVGAAERGRGRKPSLPARICAAGGGRLGMHRIVLEEWQEGHRAPIVLQGSTRGTGKGGCTGAAGAAVSGSST